MGVQVAKKRSVSSEMLSLLQLRLELKGEALTAVERALNRGREAALESLDCLEAPGLGGFLGGLVE